jgi:branched-chain amino acid transport system substrate-binding protein
MARWTLKAAALAASAVVLAGCGGGGGAGAPLGAPTQDGSQGAADLGGEGLSGKPIKVGFLVDQTGALADYGHAHQLVGEAAARRINENGGIGGRPVELVIADTESDPSAAAPRARQLVESGKVDFLLGSNTSGVVLAVAAVAKETGTVYFPTAGGALLGTPKNANRYVFDFNTNVRQETKGGVGFIKNHTDATRWGSVVADYAWGWDQENYFADNAKADGLTVEKQIRAPLGTSDFLGYLRGGLPDDVQGVYFANFGTDFLAFIRDLKATHPDVVKMGGNYVVAGQNVADLGDAAEGTYVISGYPQNAAAMNSPYDAEYRKAIGMDDQGREEKNGRYLVSSYQWSTWESLNAIKEVVEESGWKSKDDTMSFIETLEGHKFKESADFPSGDKYFRPEDHLSVKNIWIEQIKGGELTVAAKIPADDMLYDPLVDYTK